MNGNGHNRATLIYIRDLIVIISTIAKSPLNNNQLKDHITSNI